MKEGQVSVSESSLDNSGVATRKLRRSIFFEGSEDLAATMSPNSRSAQQRDRWSSLGSAGDGTPTAIAGFRSGFSGSIRSPTDAGFVRMEPDAGRRKSISLQQAASASAGGPRRLSTIAFEQFRRGSRTSTTSGSTDGSVALVPSVTSGLFTQQSITSPVAGGGPTSILQTPTNRDNGGEGGPKFMSVATRYRRAVVPTVCLPIQQESAATARGKSPRPPVSGTSPQQAGLSPGGSTPSLSVTSGGAGGPLSARSGRPGMVAVGGRRTSAHTLGLSTIGAAVSQNPPAVTTLQAAPPTSTKTKRNRILKQDIVTQLESDSDDEQGTNASPLELVPLVDQQMTLMKQLTAKSLSSNVVQTLSTKLTGGIRKQPLSVEQMRKKLATNMLNTFLQSSKNERFLDAVVMVGARVDGDWIRRLVKKLSVHPVVAGKIAGGDPTLHSEVEWTVSVYTQALDVGLSSTQLATVQSPRNSSPSPTHATHHQHPQLGATATTTGAAAPTQQQGGSMNSLPQNITVGSSSPKMKMKLFAPSKISIGETLVVADAMEKPIHKPQQQQQVEFRVVLPKEEDEEQPLPPPIDTDLTIPKPPPPPPALLSAAAAEEPIIHPPRPLEMKQRGHRMSVDNRLKYFTFGDDEAEEDDDRKNAAAVATATVNNGAVSKTDRLLPSPGQPPTQTTTTTNNAGVDQKKVAFPKSRSIAPPPASSSSVVNEDDSKVKPSSTTLSSGNNERRRTTHHRRSTAAGQHKKRGVSLFADETTFFQSDSSEEEDSSSSSSDDGMMDTDDDEDEDISYAVGGDGDSPKNHRGKKSAGAPEEEREDLLLDTFKSIAKPIGQFHNLGEAVAFHRGRFGNAASQHDPLEYVGASNSNTPRSFVLGSNRGRVSPRLSPVNLTLTLNRKPSDSPGLAAPALMLSDGVIDKVAQQQPVGPVQPEVMRRHDVDYFISNLVHELQFATELRSLRIHHTPMSYKHVGRLVYGSFVKHYSETRFLQRLSLRFCELDGVAIAPLLTWLAVDTRGCSGLHTLDLADNVLTAKDLSLLSIAICGCPSLKAISLRNNPLCLYYDEVQQQLDDDYQQQVKKIMAARQKKQDELAQSRAFFTSSQSPRGANGGRFSIAGGSLNSSGRSHSIANQLDIFAARSSAPGSAMATTLSIGNRSGNNNSVMSAHLPPPPQNPEPAPHQLIASFMMSINQLERLDLGFCGLNDQCVVKICNYLHDSDCRLKDLNLDGCFITVSVSALLLDTVKRHCRSLFSVSLQYVYFANGAQFQKKLCHTLRRRLWRYLKERDMLRKAADPHGTQFFAMSSSPAAICGIDGNPIGGPAGTSDDSGGGALRKRRGTVQGSSSDSTPNTSFSTTGGGGGGGDSEWSKGMLSLHPPLRPLYFRLKALEEWCDARIEFRAKLESQSDVVHQKLFESKSNVSSLARNQLERTATSPSSRMTSGRGKGFARDAERERDIAVPPSSSTAFVDVHPEETMAFGHGGGPSSHDSNDVPSSPNSPMLSNAFKNVTTLGNFVVEVHPHHPVVPSGEDSSSEPTTATAAETTRSAGGRTRFVNVGDDDGEGTDDDDQSRKETTASLSERTFSPAKPLTRKVSKSRSDSTGSSMLKEKLVSMRLPMPKEKVPAWKQEQEPDLRSPTNDNSDISSSEPSDDEGAVDKYLRMIELSEEEGDLGIVDDWGGWNLTGLKRGYGRYTSNEPSAVKRRNNKARFKTNSPPNAGGGSALS